MGQRSAPPVHPRSAPPVHQRSAPPFPEQHTTTTGGQERLHRPYQPSTFFDSAAPAAAPAATAPPAPAGRAPGYADGKPRPNGAAVAALVFGIVGLSVLAIVLGFLGRVRAKTAGRGRTMATTGLVLGVIWLAVEGGAIAVATQSDRPRAAAHQTTSTPRVMDPGCAAVEGSGAAATMEADAKAGDVTKLATDFRTMATQLTAARAKTTRPVAATAMKQFAADLTTYAASLGKGQAFTQAEINKFVADAGAVDRACAP
jgi:hypothetical protein